MQKANCLWYFPSVNLLQKLMLVLVVLAILGVGAGGFFFYQYQKTNKELQTIKTDPNTLKQAAQEEVKKLIEEVGKLISLPEGEEPTVATVTDVEKLKDQPFFSKAKNGDKVIIYTQAKKAILYDPIARKIVDVAPVNIGTSSATQTIRIVLRNGTTTTGLTTKVEPDVKKSISNVNIVTKENASQTDYEKSVVIALTDSAKDAAAKLAKDLNITTGELPGGESKPSNADLLVILGKDRI